MIKTKASYDFVMKNITEEGEKKFAYIPELGKKIQVVFINSQLYLADSSLRSKVWFPVNRDKLADGPLPPVPMQQTHRSKFSEKVGRAMDDYASPPPPYSAHIGWPSNTDAGMVEAKEKNSIHSSYEQVDIDVNPKGTFLGDVANLSNKAADTVELQKKPENTPVRRRRQKNYVDPNTGKTHYNRGIGLISSSSWSSRKMVPPEPGGKDSKKIPGLVSKNSIKSRRLVDSETGKTPGENTKEKIPYYQWRNTQLVDALTGKKATSETDDPIPFSRFLSRGYRDRDTGERVKPGTPGAMTAAAYKNFLAGIKT